MAQPQGRKATTTSVASPLGGWNARDSVAEMNPMDAVVLENFFPTPSDVTLRKGYTKYSTGITGQVYSLMSYNFNLGQKLFAVANGVIYDVTNQGAAVSVFTGLTNSKFQHVNITTSGGHFLIACNGADPVMVYDGTNWAKMATTTTAATISGISRTSPSNVATVTTSSPHGLITGNRITITASSESSFLGVHIVTVTSTTSFTFVSTGTSTVTGATGTYSVLGITGVDSSTFVNVNLFKNRLFFTQQSSLKCWYLDVDSIAGAATGFDFGGIARNGGFLQAIGTWTLDAGQGADDYFVAVTNMGETIVYVGTDITDPNNWALKGVWQFGQTFNRRCFFKWAGDLLLLTQDGLVPLSGALQSSRLDPRINLTDKIYYAVSQAATLYYDNFGWQINYFASENMLILNVPISGGTQQFVMHTITKSWGQFTGIEANCWEVHGKAGMFFGGNGYVGRFYDQLADNDQNIKATCQQAYSYFNSRGTLKRFTMVRPIIITDNSLPTVLCGVSTDFDTAQASGTVTFNPVTTTAGKWDISKWDESYWGGGYIVNKQWQGVTGIGYAGGISMKVASQGVDFHWASTDYVFETGGVL